MTTLVYGRTEYAEPLVELGTTDDADARRAFPGEWVELVTFPEERIVWIVRDGREIDGAGDDARARD